MSPTATATWPDGRTAGTRPPRSVVYVRAPHEGNGIVEALAAHGMPVDVVADAASAAEALKVRACVLVVVHLADERSGSATIRTVRAKAPHVPIAALCDPARPLLGVEAVRAGASDLLTLPLDPQEVATVVANAMDRASVGLAPGDPAIPAARDAVVANSPAMRATLEEIRATAGDARGVALIGEPGSGRRIVARAIHARGDRAGRPFVEVDCRVGTLTDLELRLFGVTDRRPSGPERRTTERLARSGALVRANGGTLFLRGLLEAPPRVQARLVRVLRDREAVAQEDRGHLEIDVRPIASIEPGPDSIGDERVCRDLYDRIAQVRVEIPPFRRRREDLPLIATWMLQDVCERRSLPVKAFSRAALVTLSALPWAGNGPELLALLEILAAASARPVIQLEDLLAHVRLDRLTARIETGGTLKDARARFEREWISATLIKHHGRVGDAARALGIQRTNLYRKVRQLKVARTLLTPRKTNL